MNRIERQLITLDESQTIDIPKQTKQFQMKTKQKKTHQAHTWNVLLEKPVDWALGFDQNAHITVRKHANKSIIMYTW